jgi:DNA alkylation repair enzyme
LGQEIVQYYESFGIDQFVKDCLQSDWDDLKLMERSDRITQSLHNQFPKEFKQAANLLKQIGPSFTGLAPICLPNYVAKYGLDDWQISMEALAVLTRYSTGEFAIRPFLIKYPKETSQQMLIWSKSNDSDIRRLASEGMRPRLPWGIRLKQYMIDPTDVLKVLNNLIYDNIKYVQKSVANNLNDISKDNPQLVLDFAKQYINKTSTSDWVIKQGLRTLFKKGDPES